MVVGTSFTVLQCWREASVRSAYKNDVSRGTLLVFDCGRHGEANYRLGLVFRTGVFSGA